MIRSPRLALAASLCVSLAIAACKKEPPAPAAPPAAPAAPPAAPAPASAPAMSREAAVVSRRLGDAIPLPALRPGELLKYPTFSLTYRGLRSKPGEPKVLARHVFATTNAHGKTVEVMVVDGTSVAMQLGGALYRIDTRGGVLKIGNL